MICASTSDISYPGMSENSYIVHALDVVVRIRGHVALNPNDVYVHNMFKYVQIMFTFISDILISIHATVAALIYDSIKILKTTQCCWVWRNLCDKRL